MKQFGENFFIGGPSAVGNDLYFTGGGSGVWQIYRSNGTEMGTGPITAPGIVGARFTAFAGQIVFAGDSRATTTEVISGAWTTRRQGCRACVKDVFPGLDRGVYSPYFVRSGSLLYFNGDDGVHGIEPWTIAQPDAVLDAPAGGITSHALEFTLGAPRDRRSTIRPPFTPTRSIGATAPRGALAVHLGPGSRTPTLLWEHTRSHLLSRIAMVFPANPPLLRLRFRQTPLRRSLRLLSRSLRRRSPSPPWVPT